jgi:3-oxoacyl-[acyl-carrier-protein] synthase I
MLERRDARCCVVAGVDSFLTARTLAAYHAQRRLLTIKNSDGFLPGEAAAAIALSFQAPAGGGLRCLGVGRGQEPAVLDSDRPLRADGLVQAYRAAFQDAGAGYEQVDYRLTDISGEQYAFKDASLALSRTMRSRREAFDLWHPSDCIGRVDAASVPLVLGVALQAARKRYAPGPGVLCHFSGDGGARAALVLREHGPMEGGAPWAS